MLNKEHPVYLETVTFRNIMKFTALQAAYLCMVWGVTWAGAVGIAFPFLIVLVIPARQYIMPKIFDRWTLSQLDTAEYEHTASAPSWVRLCNILAPLDTLLWVPRVPERLCMVAHRAISGCGTGCCYVPASTPLRVCSMHSCCKYNSCRRVVCSKIQNHFPGQFRESCNCDTVQHACGACRSLTRQSARLASQWSKQSSRRGRPWRQRCQAMLVSSTMSHRTRSHGDDTTSSRTRYERRTICTCVVVRALSIPTDLQWIVMRPCSMGRVLALLPRTIWRMALGLIM